MKKMIFAAIMMTIAISANAMTYNEARQEALFLSDKMAYELDLTEEQYEAIYEINLDYLMSINSRGDAYGSWWNVRNRDLEIVLSPTQYRLYVSRAYFYRPLTWTGGAWSFGIYGRYHRGHFYRHHPAVYSSYRGGHRIGHHSYYHGRNYYPQPRHGHGPQPGHHGSQPRHDGPHGGNHGSHGGNHGPHGGNYGSHGGNHGSHGGNYGSHGGNHGSHGGNHGSHGHSPRH